MIIFVVLKDTSDFDAAEELVAVKTSKKRARDYILAQLPEDGTYEEDKKPKRKTKYNPNGPPPQKGAAEALCQYRQVVYTLKPRNANLNPYAIEKWWLRQKD